MGVFYAIKRACTNRFSRRFVNCSIFMLEMSFFTMRTIILGLGALCETMLLTAAYILRRVRFLSTAVLNVFFGAVGENLKRSAGAYLTLKKGECASRPVFTTILNSFIERRSAFESMVRWLNGQTAAAFGSTALYDVLACCSFRPLAEAMGTGALSLFWIICE